jgi:hypothetical protein
VATGILEFGYCLGNILLMFAKKALADKNHVLTKPFLKNTKIFIPDTLYE